MENKTPPEQAPAVPPEKKEEKKERKPIKNFQIIHGDVFDERAFKENAKACQPLGALVRRGKETLPTIEDLLEDLWRSLYKPSPKATDKPVPTSHLLNAMIMKTMASVDEWHALRAYTKFDQESSILGSLDLGEKILKSIPPDLSKQIQDTLDAAGAACKAQGTAQKAGQDAKDAQGEADGAKGTPGEGQAKGKAREAQGKAKDAQDKADKAESEAQKVEKALQDSLKKNETKTDLEKAVKDAVKEALDNMDTLNSLGWGHEPGTKVSVPLQERIRIAQALMKNRKFREVVREAGRYRRFALAQQRRKVVHGCDEIHDLEYGNELSRLLPSETVFLNNSVLKREFFRRFAEKGLQQYQMRGVERANRGPIIAVFDGSGSMDGEPEIWAKAFCLGMYFIAKKQRRPCALAQFGSYNELETWDFPPGLTAEEESRRVENLAGFFFSGGTDFDRPLEWALKKLKERPYKKADLLFVSDGYCEANEKTINAINEARKAGLKVTSIYVGGGYDADEDDEDSGPASLKKFSDKTVSIKNFRDDEKAREVAYSI